MINFVDEIEMTIKDKSIFLDNKIAIIKDIMEYVEIVQINEKVLESDITIPAKVLYKGKLVEGVGICAKDVKDWKFLPGRTKENGIVNVKISKRGVETNFETFFIVLQFWKNEFFKENNLEFPKYGLKISWKFIMKME